MIKKDNILRLTMKKAKEFQNKLFDAASIISSSLAALAIVAFICAVFIEGFANMPCTNISTCYAVVIFIAGIIVTLKIRLLDEGKRWVEWILFIAGAAFNVIFLLCAFVHDCQGNEAAAIKLLNATIWADIVIVLKSLGLVIALYYKKYLGYKKKKTEINKTDLFQYWLARKDKSALIERALTDRSYKKENPYLKDENVNYSLATFGDSIIKGCLSRILLDKVDKLSEEKKKYETDEFFVRTIAKHYSLIDYIRKDKTDPKMPNDYEYSSEKKGREPHKYIATAVEAMVGAIYLETEDLEAITAMIEAWMKLKQ